MIPIKELIAKHELIPERKAALDAARVDLLRAENAALRARIAELEKALDESRGQLRRYWFTTLPGTEDSWVYEKFKT